MALRTLGVPALLLVLAGVTPIDAVEQVELHLTSGAVVQGELVSQDDDQVVVKSAMTSKKGTSFVTLGYRRALISSIVAQKDPEDDYHARDVAVVTALDHATLATWCQDHGMTERAVIHAQRALVIDAHEATAAKLLATLGWVQADGVWVLESAWLAKQGKVRYHGQVMTLAEADAAAALQKTQQAGLDAQKNVTDRTARIAFIDRQLDDLQKRPPLIEAEIAKATATIATDQANVARVQSSKAAFDAAEQALSQAQQANSYPGVHGMQNLAPLQTAAENTQKAYNAAQRDSSGATGDIAHQKAQIIALQDEKAHLTKQHDELTRKRVTAVAELAQAQAALKAITATSPAVSATAAPAPSGEAPTTSAAPTPDAPKSPVHASP